MAKRTRNQNSCIIEEMHSYGIYLDSREIFLHGHINGEEDPGTDYRNANKLLKNLRILDSINKSPIIIHQHNLGGVWDCGMLMYDAIHSCESQVIVIMHGLAMSMGSIVPQAADKRVIMPNCLFMVHDGNTGINQDMTHKQTQSAADLEKALKETMMDIYAEVCVEGEFFKSKQTNEKKVKEFIQEKFDRKEDWYLTATEAVYFGFADEVLTKSVEDYRG